MRVIPKAVVSLAAILPLTLCIAQDYAAALQHARNALATGDYPAALKQLDEAIQIDPDSASAYVLMGQVFLQLQRYPEASEALARGAALTAGIATPEGAMASQLLALSLAREGRNTESLAVLDRLVDTHPDRPALHLLRGNVRLALGNTEAARDDFESEIQMLGAAGASRRPAPHTPPAAAWEGLGICAYRLGDDATALDALLRASEEPDARYHLALTLSRVGRHADAIDLFDSVLAREPDHRGALQGLARSAGAIGRTDDRGRALTTLEALYRLDEERRSAKIKVSFLRSSAMARASAGDARGASAELEQALRLAPDDVELKLDLARALTMSGERRRGEEILRALIVADPLRAEAHFYLGRSLLDGSNAAAAAAPLETACRLAPMKPAFHVALGQAYLAVNRMEEGVRELRLAKNLGPGDPENVYSLGVALARAGALNEAVGQLQSAASMSDDDPRPHEALADLYTRLGETELSRREREISRRLRSRSSDPA